MCELVSVCVLFNIFISDLAGRLVEGGMLRM